MDWEYRSSEHCLRQNGRAKLTQTYRTNHPTPKQREPVAKCSGSHLEFMGSRTLETFRKCMMLSSQRDECFMVNISPTYSTHGDKSHMGIGQLRKVFMADRPTLPERSDFL